MKWRAHEAKSAPEIAAVAKATREKGMATTKYEGLNLSGRVLQCNATYSTYPTCHAPYPRANTTSRAHCLVSFGAPCPTSQGGGEWTGQAIGGQQARWCAASDKRVEG